MDAFSLKDAIIIGGFLLALWRFSTQQKKDASSVAAWRATTDAAIARLEEKLQAHKEAHTQDASEAKAFRNSMYDFARDTRERLIRLENGGSKE